MAMVRLRVNAQMFGWDIGDVIEVERTPMVAGLIRNEYVTVLEETVPDTEPDSPAELPDTVQLTTEQVAALAHAGGEVAAPAPGSGFAAGAHGTLSVEVAKVPPRTGKGSGAEEWRKFLRGQGLDMTDRIGGVDNATKGELIDFWDAEVARRG